MRKNNRKQKSEGNTTEDENKGKENNRIPRRPRQQRPRKIDTKTDDKTDTSVDNEVIE